MMFLDSPRRRSISPEGTRIRGVDAAALGRDSVIWRIARSAKRGTLLSSGDSPRHRTRHAPPRCPLPPRPRQALRPNPPAPGRKAAARRSDGDVPRDGDAVLAGEGRRGKERTVLKAAM